MSRRPFIALVVAALLIAGSTAAFASGEDAQKDAAAAAKDTKAEAQPDDAAAKKETDDAKQELEDAKFNTLEDLFALLAAPSPPVADASIESRNAAATDEPAAPGVQWTRVETTTERSD